PAELKNLTPQQTKRRRDLGNLRWILGTVNWPTLDDHLENAPYIVHLPLFYFWEGFNGVLNSSLFHLYDAKLLSELRAVHRYWGVTLAFGQHYRTNLGANFIFAN